MVKYSFRNAVKRIKNDQTTGRVNGGQDTLMVGKNNNGYKNPEPTNSAKLQKCKKELTDS